MGPLPPQQHPCSGQMDPTLVDELVEGMLTISPWLPPHNGPCLVVHTGAGLGDVLPIGLHVTLEWEEKHRLLSASLASVPKSCLEASGIHLPCPGP